MAVAAAGLTLTALVVALALTRGPTLPPGPSPTVFPSVGIAASSGESASAPPSGGLTEAQADLLDHVPAGFRDTCEPTPPTDATAQTLASLVCAPDPMTSAADRVWYEAFGPTSRSALSDAFFTLTSQHAIPHGDCARSASAYGDWDLTGAYAGQRLCYTDTDGHAWIAWTYDLQRILVRAERLDGNRNALFAWSQTTAPLLN